MIHIEGGQSRIQDDYSGEYLTDNLKLLFIETKANNIYRYGNKKKFFINNETIEN